MKRMICLMALMMMLMVPARAQDPGHAPQKPQPLGISLKEFVELYNAQQDVDAPIGQTTDLENQLAGIVYLPVSELVDVYVQLSYDQRKDAVQFVGCVMQQDLLPDYEVFLSTAGRLMSVVFTGMTKQQRQQMLLSAIEQGTAAGDFPENGGSVLYREGSNVIEYIVRDDGGRQVVIYREG